MRRIAIVGCCGAGKSTVANFLGSKLDLPIIHLDSYYWQPKWVETAAEEWIKIQQSLIKGDRWIIDGNYINTMDLRLEAADTIIWLNFPRRVCLWRIFQRYFKYRGIVRPDMADDCVERLNWDFLLYVWSFPHNQKQLMLSKIKRYQHYKRLIILKNPQQLDSFLSKFK